MELVVNYRGVNSEIWRYHCLLDCKTIQKCRLQCFFVDALGWEAVDGRGNLCQRSGVHRALLDPIGSIRPYALEAPLGQDPNKYGFLISEACKGAPNKLPNKVLEKGG